MANLSWKQVRNGIADIIRTTVPAAIVLDEWPVSESEANINATDLRSPTDGGRIHAWLLGSMKVTPMQEKIGGGPNHGQLISEMTLRISAFAGFEIAGGLTSTSTSRGDFEDEMEAVKLELLKNRLTLGITGSEVNQLRQVFPLSFDEILTEDSGDAILNASVGSIRIQKVEQW